MVDSEIAGKSFNHHQHHSAAVVVSHGHHGQSSHSTHENTKHERHTDKASGKGDDTQDENKFASILVLASCLICATAANTFAACGNKAQSTGNCNSYMTRSTGCEAFECDISGSMPVDRKSSMVE